MKKHSPGSGLLFTVLTLALFTTLSLITVRSFLGAARTAVRVQVSHDAYTVAGQGLNEGLFWAIKNSTDNFLASGNTPWYRQSDPLCTNYSPDLHSAKPTSNCSHYGFAVWREVSLGAGKTTYQLPARALVNAASNQETLQFTYLSSSPIITSGTVPISLPRTITLVAHSLSGTISSVKYDCSMGCISNHPNNIGTVTASPATVYVDQDTATIIFKVVQSIGVETPILSLKFSDIPIKISRGFTSIASTGYVGGVMRRRFANIYQGDTAPFHPYEYESSDDIDANGCLVGYKDSTNPNDASTCYSQRSDGTP